jgi:hypothetical protein
MRFAWSAAAVRTPDSAVRRYAWVLRVAIAVIVATLLIMILATASHPSRRWDIL